MAPRLSIVMLLASVMVLAGARLATPQIRALPPIFDTPIYDPEAKRYFELVNATPPPGTPYPRNEGFDWDGAAADAAKHTFKGVQGRLAVIDAIEVHEFLLRNFRPDSEAWIGLRYWCTRHKLEWSNGQFMDPGAFNAWAEEWNRDMFTCKSGVNATNPNAEQFAPIAYSHVPEFRWIGKGWSKRYLYYFVEFPTGKP
jgi:Lectin C-type domain